MAKRALTVVAIVAVALVAIYFLFPGLTFRLARRAELRAAGLERRSIDVGRDHIAYLAGGAGEALLLIHGFSADSGNWVRVARYLTPHFYVVAPDLPGFGESTRDETANYSVPAQVERVHAFAEALGLGTFNVGGNSMGGTITGVLAARHPAEVRSLWLLDPGSVASAKQSELEARLARGENPFLVEDADGFERLLDFVFVKRPYIPRPIEGYLAAQAVEHRSFNEKVGRDLVAKPIALEKEVKGLEVPTLIVWGDRDRLVDVSGAEILHAALPNSQVVVMTNTGHIPMVERPEAAAKDYLRFRGKSGA
jgi:abhydrolase domain-containing protein 6